LTPLTPIIFASSILSFYKHQVTSLIWQARFTRRSFNIFWMVILCQISLYTGN